MNKDVLQEISKYCRPDRVYVVKAEIFQMSWSGRSELVPMHPVKLFWHYDTCTKFIKEYLKYKNYDIQLIERFLDTLETPPMFNKHTSGTIKEYIFTIYLDKINYKDSKEFHF